MAGNSAFYPPSGTGGGGGGVTSINGLTGAITLTPGTNVTFSTVGNDITINATGTGPPFSNTVSLQYNGTNQYVDMGNNYSFEYTMPFSLSCWVYLTSVPIVGTLMGKTLGGGSGYQGYTLELANQIPAFVLRNTAGSNEAYITGPALALNTWYHLVGTSDGSGTATGMLMYYNGVLQSTTIGANSLSATIVTSADFQLGGNTNTGFYYNGIQDECSVFNDVLTQSTITSMYNGGLPTNLANSPQASNMIGWWRMGDAPDTSSVLYDRSISGLNGTPVNITNSAFSSNVPV